MLACDSGYDRADCDDVAWTFEGHLDMFAAREFALNIFQIRYPDGDTCSCSPCLVRGPGMTDRCVGIDGSGGCVEQSVLRQPRVFQHTVISFPGKSV